ncbi:MAG: hypothetical protein Q4D02_01800 [Clostridia bacterium]|nr:hypothetical protein [Clostridia bacterium]
MAYYFGMKPEEYWNSTYREISTFCQANMSRINDDFKMEIVLKEAETDKLLSGDAMRTRPKILRLKDTFKKLFE